MNVARRELDRLVSRDRASGDRRTVETFPERHHFDPPHRIEPERLSHSLLALWQRAEP